MQQLPQGAEAWRNVALLYQNASNERDLCKGEDICDDWVRILGATSDESDHDKDIGSRELDNFSLGSGFDNNPKVAAATAQNDDGNRLADKQANSEEVEMVDAATVCPVNANHVHPQLLPTFVGGHPSGNVATRSVVSAMTSDARGGGGQGGRVGGQGAGRVDPPRWSPSLLESSKGGGGVKRQRTPPIVNKGQSQRQSTGWQN
jgi:hypothetical protein